MAGGGHGTKAVIAALLANAGIAVAKFVGFLITGSASMLAESIHSVADSGNQGLLLLGGRRARRLADESHPFGYGRERYFWAFIVALVLFSLGGAFAMFEGIEKIRHPHEVEAPAVAIGILLFAVALETYSFRTAIVEANKIRGDAGWWQFIRRSKNPELPVVLLEDFGAEVGLLIALAAVSATLAFDDPIFDGIGTLSIGVLLTVIAIVLAVEMKSLLLGETASPEVQVAIRSAIDDEPAVERLIHLRTQHLGPDELLVGAKVSFDPALSVPELAGAVNRVEANVRRRVPEARVMYIEPDVVGTDLPADPFVPDRPQRGGRVSPADAAGRRQLEALGELIRKQRQQAELTLRDLAERANVSNPYLSQIERGLHEPSVRVLKAIAGALNLSAESLLIQAGVLEGHDPDAPAEPVTVEDAVNADPRLNADQRAALMSVYRSFVEDDAPKKPPRKRT